MVLGDITPLGKFIFEYQAPAVLNQAAPVQNTWYTILDTTENVRVYGIGANVEDADETLEVQLTVDGETIGAQAKACTHSTEFWAYIYPRPITRVDACYLASGAAIGLYRSYLIDGKSVKVEVRKTTAGGAGNLTGIVTYGVLKSAS